MQTIILALSLLFIAPIAAALDPPAECGDSPETAPAFTLIDQNPTSLSFDQEIKLEDYLGRVFVLYWAQAS